MFKSISVLRFLLFAFPLLLVTESAFAWVGVGPDASCEVRTVQAAIDRIISRQVHGDFVDPHIVVAGGTFNEALQINARGIGGSHAILTLTGGYDSGCHAPQAGSITTINAANRSRSVVAIEGTIALSLDSLQLSGANTAGNGGGIAFGGNGTLDVSNVSVIGNHAGYGGGIYANAQSWMTVTLHPSTSILSNSADHAGGGIRVQGNARLVMLRGTVVYDNSVNYTDPDGAGGGLQVVSPASAEIQSADIQGNNARYGGGLAVNGSLASVIFETEAGGHPSNIFFNTAGNTGGGLFISKGSVLCGQCKIEFNSAQEGAATYVDVGGGGLAINTGSVNYNVARTLNGNATGGSAMLTQTNSSFGIYKTEVRGNSGAHVYHGFGNGGAAGSGPAFFADVLIAENQITENLFVMDEKGEADVRRITVANNIIGGSSIFSVPGNFTLVDSIIWQFAKTTLAGHTSGDSRGLAIENVITTETASLSGWPGILNADPRFADPSHGDFHLTVFSPAVDYSSAEPDVDLDGASRTVDLASTPNRDGPMDLGAYELQVGLLSGETFDGVTAPALPLGWTNTHAGAGPGWITVASGAFNSPNAAYTDDTPTITDKSLTMPTVIVGGSRQLSFRHKIDLDASPAPSVVTFDGVVLEISIAGAPFQDIFAAGGSFASGGYDHIVFASSGNPLAGRNAWGGTSAGYQQVVVNLPAGIGNATVAVRWRMGTDAFGAGLTGYWLDDIRIK